jgi:tetratricopeptide (TPR) repeat protein
VPAPRFEPLEATVLPDLPPPRRPWPRWLLVGGALSLAVGLMSLALWGVARLATGLRGTGSVDADSLVDHWESPAERLTNIAAAMNATEVGCSPGELRAMERVLSRVAAASRESDDAAYLGCFDISSLVRRIGRHPAARSDRSLALWTLKAELQTSLETPASLGEISIVRVERGRRPDQVLVYTVESDYFQTSVFRWWLVQTGRNWRVFDYERLDHGQSLAAGWALRGAIDRDPHRYNYYSLQTALEGSPGGQGFGPLGRYLPPTPTPLDRFVDMELPAVVRDVARLDLAWALIGNGRPTAALAACDSIEREDEHPGVLLVRAQALEQLDHPAKALAAAGQYQRLAGRDPHALMIEAEAHEDLDDFAAAANRWAALLELCPDHDQALHNYCRLADAAQLEQLPAIVARRQKPLDAAVQQAHAALGRDDLPTFEALVKFVAERSPESTELQALAASRLLHEEQYEEAAVLFLQASRAEWLPEKKESHFHQYLSALTQADQVVAGYEQADDPQAAFEYLTDGFESEEALITAEQFGPLLAAHRAKTGGGFSLDYLEGLLHLREKRFVEAERMFAAAADLATEEYEQEMCRDRRIEALVAQGQGELAYQQFGRTSEVFQAIAWQLQVAGRWDDLRRLIAAHRRSEPDDLWCDYFEAAEMHAGGDFRGALAAIGPCRYRAPWARSRCSG